MESLVNTQAQIALSVLSSVDNRDDKVYRSTTVPINNNRGELLKNDRSQSSNYRGDENGENGVYKQPQFSNLPSREPIDLQFKDIVYTVNMGFRKGKNFFV